MSSTFGEDYSVYDQTDADNYELSDEEYALVLKDIDNFGAIMDGTANQDNAPLHLGNIDSNLKDADWLKSRKDLAASGVDVDAFTKANPDLPISQSAPLSTIAPAAEPR